MSIQDSYNCWADTYDLVNNLTRDLDQTITQETLADLRFNTSLDIGCGTGKNTAFLAQISKTVYAIDFSEAMIENAKEKIKAPNVKFSTADITQNWTFNDQSFDLISCNLVLEHIKDLSSIFSEAYRTLSKNGHFYISELHPFWQYRGKKAIFEQNGKTLEITAFIHNITDFLNAAKAKGFILNTMKEYWHAEDKNMPPRIVTFMFEK